jgi:hypothetical protein
MKRLMWPVPNTYSPETSVCLVFHPISVFTLKNGGTFSHTKRLIFLKINLVN